MASRHLATYLNDHLAGSVTAIELLDYISSTCDHAPIKQVAQELRDEVTADRKELETLIGHCEIGQSIPRKVSAWMAEKLTQLKLRLDDPVDGSFRLFEATEAVSLGIEGKRLLWCALASLSETLPELRLLDYQRLIQRAEAQRGKVEQVRLEAARQAITRA